MANTCINYVAVFYEFDCGGWSRSGPYVIAKTLTLPHAQCELKSWRHFFPSPPPRIQAPDDPRPTNPPFTISKVITNTQYERGISNGT